MTSSKKPMRWLGRVVLLALLSGTGSAEAQEYRGYWVDTPSIAQAVASGEAELSWERAVTLQASRRGDDRNGRTYTIIATVTDRACNTREVQITVTVLHDQRGN